MTTRWADQQGRLLDARRQANAAAEAWTARTAARLGISTEAVDAAIRRGWTAQEIDDVKVAAKLLCSPRRLRGTDG